MAKTLQMQPRRFEVIDVPTQVPNAPGRYDALRATLEQLPIGPDGYSEPIAWVCASKKEAEQGKRLLHAGKDGWAERMHAERAARVKTHIAEIWGYHVLFARWVPGRAEPIEMTKPEQRRFEVVDKVAEPVAPKPSKYAEIRAQVEGFPMSKALRIGVRDADEAHNLEVALNTTSVNNKWSARMREAGIVTACKVVNDGGLWVVVTKRQVNK